MSRYARVLLLATVVTLPAYAAKPQIQWNPEYDFSTIETFQWQAPSAQSIESENPFLHRQIVSKIENELTSRGLTQVESNPDVYVTYHGSSQSNVRLESDSYGYGFGGYGRGGWGYYGYGLGGPVSTTTRVVEYQRGTLIVDIWDASDMELIWRGTANDIVISDEPDKTEKNVLKALEKMAKQNDKLRRKSQ
jgi:Domain of unknown function (DUF4136)